MNYGGHSLRLLLVFCGDVISYLWEKNFLLVGNFFLACRKKISCLWEKNFLLVGKKLPACGNFYPVLWYGEGTVPIRFGTFLFRGCLVFFQELSYPCFRLYIFLFGNNTFHLARLHVYKCNVFVAFKVFYHIEIGVFEIGRTVRGHLYFFTGSSFPKSAYN